MRGLHCPSRCHLCHTSTCQLKACWPLVSGHPISHVPCCMCNFQVVEKRLHMNKCRTAFAFNENICCQSNFFWKATHDRTSCPVSHADPAQYIKTEKPQLVKAASSGRRSKHSTRSRGRGFPSARDAEQARRTRPDLCPSSPAVASVHRSLSFQAASACAGHPPAAAAALTCQHAYALC